MTGHAQPISGSKMAKVELSRPPENGRWEWIVFLG
jgi:hypothetical protein